MIVCPTCQTENRAGAKFCKNCATRLPASASVTIPLSTNETDVLESAASQVTQRIDHATRRIEQPARAGTQPLTNTSDFIRRPPGAIFADAFLFQSMIFSDERQHRYLVTQLNIDEHRLIRCCPNRACGAIFPPRVVAPEKFCTDCGTVLINEVQSLVVIETKSITPDNLAVLAAKGLSHPYVRAPLSAFVERLAGVPRYCTVTALVEPQETPPDTLEAMKWGIGLARGLDYLHDNGVMFASKIDLACFSRAGERLVWANFANCVHHPEGYVTDRRPDVRALATLVFHWVTGRTVYERDPRLTPEVNSAFEQALTPPGLASGRELAEALVRALQVVALPTTVNYQMGRRTNVGMVRSLNEDSLLTLEINRVHQSVSQSVGIYGIADGMGGHAAGEIASGAIINTIAQRSLADLLPVHVSQGEMPDLSDWLRQAVEAANREVFALRKSAGTDMGSTLVFAVLAGNQAHIAHVGDSRAYLINAQSIQRLTTDHSLVERLIATNQITREEARNHPQRNVIYRTIGDKPKIDVDVLVQILNAGDYLLLCSDGLSGMLEDQVIRDTVLQEVSPQAACDALVEAANAAGGDDNLSAILVKITQT